MGWYKTDSIENPKKEERPYRQGLKYNTMKAEATVLRKNKISFGSHQGAETSTVYHTFIATCKISALSFYQFLKNYFTAFMEGRTDFENLTPAILGKIN
ncbi:MAG: hypothetical protein RR371_01685 [Bacteroides sp.]